MFLRYFREAQPSFTFLIMGDSRGSRKIINEPVLRNLLKLSAVKKPDLTVFLGDMVNSHGSVFSDLESWKTIFSSYYPIETCYPCIGNHEGDEAAFTKSFDFLPDNGPKGYGKTAYYFDHLNTRFICLNSNRKSGSGYIVDKEQQQWLEDVLKSNTQVHTFVFLHVPAYPTGAHYGDSLDAVPEARDELWSIFDRYNVTAVFSGHEHNYSRRLVDGTFSGSGFTFNNNIFQIISGGAGAPLSSSSKDTRNVEKGPLAVYHYIIAEVINTSVIFNVFDSNNSIIDSFKIDK